MCDILFIKEAFITFSRAIHQADRKLWKTTSGFCFSTSTQPRKRKITHSLVTINIKAGTPLMCLEKITLDTCANCCEAITTKSCASNCWSSGYAWSCRWRTWMVGAWMPTDELVAPCLCLAPSRWEVGINTVRPYYSPKSLTWILLTKCLVLTIAPNPNKLNLIQSS